MYTDTDTLMYTRCICIDMAEHTCPNEPERRNNHDEPLCDDCGRVVVDRANSDFGCGCLCHACQSAYNQELSDEFGIEI